MTVLTAKIRYVCLIGNNKAKENKFEFNFLELLFYDDCVLNTNRKTISYDFITASTLYDTLYSLK